MPSAAGKRVGRVLAGCSKPEAGDKPGLSYLARYTRLQPVSLHRSSKNVRSETHLRCTESAYVGILVHFGTGIVIIRNVGISGIHLEHLNST